jgi:hypothetical protein
MGIFHQLTDSFRFADDPGMIGEGYADLRDLPLERLTKPSFLMCDRLWVDLSMGFVPFASRTRLNTEPSV